MNRWTVPVPASLPSTSGQSSSARSAGTRNMSIETPLSVSRVR